MSTSMLLYALVVYDTWYNTLTQLLAFFSFITGTLLFYTAILVRDSWSLQDGSGMRNNMLNKIIKGRLLFS